MKAATQNNRPRPPAHPGMRPSQVAAAYGVHTVTVIRWITNGVRGERLEGRMIGGGWRVTQDQLDDFIVRCTTASLPEPRADRTRRAKPKRLRQEYESSMRELKEMGIL